MAPNHHLSLGLPNYSRRDFLRRATIATSALAAAGAGAWPVAGTEPGTVPVVVFSKVYQELKLDFNAAAELTAEAGLQGVDCPLRPGGEITPERVVDELPRYVEVLKRHQLQMPLLTTAITSVSSPNAEVILRTAKKLGVQSYRLGFINRQPEASMEKQVREVRAQLKDLAAMNQEIGIGALLQNHSSSGGRGYFGGNLGDLVQAIQGFDPAQIGVAFDIGHALVTHGDEWKRYFDPLKPHFRIAYIKDVKRQGGWVPFGQGDIAGTGYFALLKEMKYQAPISLHIEFDWAGSSQAKDRAALLSALQTSGHVLRGWLAA